MGPIRAANMSPAFWALREGLRLSPHLDILVTPMLALQAVWSQTERKSVSGVVIGPQQIRDKINALRTVTIDVAWQVFMDDKVGSIEVVKRADLIVLSGNPLIQKDVRTLRVERRLLTEPPCINPMRNDLSPKFLANLKIYSRTGPSNRGLSFFV